MSKHILVAEDDPVLLGLYTRIFAGTGYAVSKAATFTEAKALINSHNYDLLVTDLVFPDGAGADLITIFEKKRGCARCIVVTGALSELAPERIPALAGCFMKPLDVDAFLAAVARALSEDPARQ